MGVRTEYSQEKELTEAIEKLLAGTPGLTTITDHCHVGACFVIRQNDQEETVPSKSAPVVIRKVPPGYQVFMKPKLDFVVVVDYYFWTNASESAKEGTIIRALTRIGIENTNNGIKLSIRPWDIQENIATIRACGVFDEMGSRAKEAYDRTRVQREMAQAVVDNMQAAAAEPPKDEPKAEPKAKAKGKGRNGDEDDPPMRPARKPPQDAKREPEPEPEPE